MQEDISKENISEDVKNIIIKKLQDLAVRINSKKYDLEHPYKERNRRCYDVGYYEGYEKGVRVSFQEIVKFIKEI